MLQMLVVSALKIRNQCKELPELDPKAEGSYIVRNHKSNMDFHKDFTLREMNLSLAHTYIEHSEYTPDLRNIENMFFSDFLHEHIMRHDHKTIDEILVTNHQYEYRMMITDTAKAFGYLVRTHSCSYMEHIANGEDPIRNFMVEAKGAGINFNRHGDMYHQLSSGQKVFLLLRDIDDLEGIHGPRSSISWNILELLALKSIKTCVLNPGDIIRIPQFMIYATFNMETSISSSCTLNIKEAKRNLMSTRWRI